MNPEMQLEEGSWESLHGHDATFQVSRNLMLAIAASLLLHAAMLFLHFSHPVKLPVPSLSMPLDIRLVPAEKPVRKASPPEPQHKVVPHRRVIAVERHSPVHVARPERRQILPAPPSPPVSFLDSVNRARQMRDAQNDEYPDEKANRMGPFQDQGTKPVGTNGIFKLVRMDDHSAVLSFLGWHSEYSNSRQETYEVEAGPDGDIRHAVVRKMIEVIRQYYQGDFNWDSERLGQVVVLSARVRDTAELESFLMNDFFGTEQGFPNQTE